MKKVNWGIAIFILMCFSSSLTISVLAESCDINKIISENKRVSELEGQKTRLYFDESAHTIMVDMEALGWDWLNAVKGYILEQLKKMIITFALSVFGAIMIVNGIVGLISLKIQKNKYIVMSQELGRVSMKLIDLENALNKKKIIKETVKPNNQKINDKDDLRTELNSIHQLLKGFTGTNVANEVNKDNPELLKKSDNLLNRSKKKKLTFAEFFGMKKKNKGEE